MAETDKIPDEDAGKLFVGGLAHETTETSLKECFEKWGEVESVNIKFDQVTKQSRGFGFVKYKSDTSAANALSQESHYCDGKRIDPKIASPLHNQDPLMRSTKIFVGGLQAETTEERLKEYFSVYGNIVGEIQFTVDRNTNKRRGFCFIDFGSEDIVDIIVKRKYHIIGGKKVETKRAYSKDQQKVLQAQGKWPLPGSNEAQKVATALGVVRAGQTVAYANPYAAAGFAGTTAGLTGLTAGTPIIYVDPTTGAAYPAVYAAGGGTTAAAAAAYGSAYAAGTTGLEVLYQPYTTREVRYPAATLAAASTAARIRTHPYAR